MWLHTLYDSKDRILYKRTIIYSTCTKFDHYCTCIVNVESTIVRYDSPTIEVAGAESLLIDEGRPPGTIRASMNSAV